MFIFAATTLSEHSLHGKQRNLRLVTVADRRFIGAPPGYQLIETQRIGIFIAGPDRREELYNLGIEWIFFNIRTAVLQRPVDVGV